MATAAESTEAAIKLKLHLGKIRSASLMMANAQSMLDRNRYLQNISKELKAAFTLIEKLEGVSHEVH